MAAKKFRRRKWLIDDEIQVRLAVKLALCVVGYFTLFCAVAIAGPVETVSRNSEDRALSHIASYVLQHIR